MGKKLLILIFAFFSLPGFILAGQILSTGDFILKDKVVDEGNIFDGGTRTIMYKGEVPLTIDYNRGTIEMYGKEFDIPVDDVSWEHVKNSLKGTESYSIMNYARFDVYIPQDYYLGKEQALQDYFDLLHDRFVELENQVGWSSEDFYGEKLNITVYNSGTTCITGAGAAGDVWLGLNYMFGDPEVCKFPYINSSGSPSFGNLGDFEDQWIYSWGGIHESLHALNPSPILARDWLTEGWSQYYGFNIPAYFGDINQDTANYYIENALFSPREGSLGTGNFDEYVADDYHDGLGFEIQESNGYDITAWMFSMMRDNHGLDWDLFYNLLDEEDGEGEVLEDTYVRGDYYTDSYIIYLLGKASGMTYDLTNETWRYDGSSGPGWGVRNWTNVAPDLEPLTDYTINEFGDVIIKPVAIDPEGGSLTYEFNDTGTGFTWDPVEEYWIWQTGPRSGGNYAWKVTAIDDQGFVDEEEIHITIRNTCVNYIKKYWCWDCQCMFAQMDQVRPLAPSF